MVVSHTMGLQVQNRLPAQLQHSATDRVIKEPQLSLVLPNTPSPVLYELQGLFLIN